MLVQPQPILRQELQHIAHTQVQVVVACAAPSRLLATTVMRESTISLLTS